MLANDQVSVRPSGSARRRPERPGRVSGAANGIGGLLAFSYGYSSSTGNWARHYHCHADGNGNVTTLFWTYNGSHYTISTDRYDPCGRSLGHTGTSLNPLRFNTTPRDTRSGLHDYGFRFYEPATQRWLTRDPLGEWGGLNLYRFVGNDPLNRFDPLGLWYGSNPLTWFDGNGFMSGIPLRYAPCNYVATTVPALSLATAPLEAGGRSWTLDGFCQVGHWSAHRYILG